MITYIIVNESGEIIGHGDAVDEQEAHEEGSEWGTVLCGPKYEGVDPDTHYIKDGALKEYPPKPHAHSVFDFDTETWAHEDIEEAKAYYLQRVSLLAGIKRRDFITIAPGQEMTYQRKLERARQYQADPAPIDEAYPLLHKEASALALSVADLAAKIITMDALWEEKGGDIEAARLKAAAFVGGAITLAEISAAMSTFETELEAI